jgi:hypothetical protein
VEESVRLVESMWARLLVHAGARLRRRVFALLRTVSAFSGCHRPVTKELVARPDSRVFGDAAERAAVQRLVLRAIAIGERLAFLRVEGPERAPPHLG